MKESRNSTNFLRVLAIVLVVNSHMDLLYPAKVAFLATGGMMGNALFFMLSGWGLLLSMQEHPREFGEWYWRRITRIYPSVWITVIILTFPLGIYEGTITLDNILDQMRKFFFPPFWFLEALMIYYVVIFFIIRKFSYRRLMLIWGMVATIYVFYYVFLLDLSKFSIETTPFRVIFYFMVMLWGLYLGAEGERLRFNGAWDVVFLVLSISCIYGHKYLMQRGVLASWQFVEHLASFPMLYFFAKVAKSDFVSHTVMGSRYLGKTLTFVSAMTLEIFMVNNSIDILDTRLGSFPFNVIALLSLNVLVALLIFYCAKPIRRTLEVESRKLPTSQRERTDLAEVVAPAH